MPIDLSSLAPAAQRVVADSAPEKLQIMAAKGVMPGLPPAELGCVIVLLSRSDRADVKATAEATLASPPAPLLAGLLATELHPEVIDVLARLHSGRADVVEALLGKTQIEADTVCFLARHCTEAISELIATNEERLLHAPSIIEALYMNVHTRMSTADRLIELAVRNGVELTGLPAWREAAAAIAGELIAEASAEPTPDDLLFVETHHLAKALEASELEDTFDADEEGQEQVKERFKPLSQRLADMTMSQKVRRAILGTKEERMLLVREQNRIVATAAIRSPLMQESEVVLISRNRNISDEVLRVIGSTPEWLKSYSVKRNLVENPKTPVLLAQRLVMHLRDADLKSLAKSRNVTGPVKDAARRQLDRKKH